MEFFSWNLRPLLSGERIERTKRDVYLLRLFFCLGVFPNLVGTVEPCFMKQTTQSNLLSTRCLYYTGFIHFLYGKCLTLHVWYVFSWMEIIREAVANAPVDESKS